LLAQADGAPQQELDEKPPPKKSAPTTYCYAYDFEGPCADLTACRKFEVQADGGKTPHGCVARTFCDYRVSPCK
jgi:hypothetical protein